MQKSHSHIEAERLFLALFIPEDLIKEVASSWKVAKMSRSEEKKKIPSRDCTAAMNAWHGKVGTLTMFNWQHTADGIGKGGCKHNCYVNKERASAGTEMLN